jgi:hypothetical protein
MRTINKSQVKKNILFICGSINQTSMMHNISGYLKDHNLYFTPYYADGFIDALAMSGLLDFSILGGSFQENTLEYLKDHNLNVDMKGSMRDYDLVLTCSDLIIPKNIRNKKIILVQEGMTDPKNIMYYLSKWLKMPRWMASTSTTGLSGFFDYFCVASDGYRNHFIKNGIAAEKLVITGIPNYDNCIEYCNNDFPHKGFVLVATSDSRETFKYENRKKFILKTKKMAGKRQLIFKLHPNENFDRATAEINKWAPGALVYTAGNVHEMIANCEVLITKYSTVVYTGIALGKEVHSSFDLDELKNLAPQQNNGQSAKNIAEVCREHLNDLTFDLSKKKPFREKTHLALKKQVVRRLKEKFAQ